MKVVAQGTSGAGKTTALRSLEERIPGALYIPELALDAERLGDDYYFDNDVHKEEIARSMAGVALVDRDFTSTLSFVAARHGMGSMDYLQSARKVERLLEMGQIATADVYMHFTVPFEVSVARQSPDNDPVWKDADFVRKYDRAFGVVRRDFIPDETVIAVDGTNQKHDVVSHCVDALKAKNPDIIDAPALDRPFMQLSSSNEVIRSVEKQHLDNVGLVVLKPDVFHRNLRSQIMSELEAGGYQVVASKVKTLKPDDILRLWPKFWTESWWNDAVEYMTSGTSEALLCKRDGDGSAEICKDFLTMKRRLREVYRDIDETRPQVSLLHTSADPEELHLNVTAYWGDDELSVLSGDKNE